MRWKSSSSIVILALVLTTSIHAEDGGYREIEVDSGGTISGRVFFEEDYPEARKRKVNINADTCGLRVTSEQFVVDPDSKGLANAVLLIEKIQEGKPFSTAESAISQLKCRYDPHVSVMRSGESLSIKNEDPILHNVHAYQGKSSLFNLAQPTRGVVTERRLEDEGVVRLKCDVHPWMSAYVVIVNNPYVALSDKNGEFSIGDIPSGEYTLMLWHEVMGRSTKTVTVKPDEVTRVDFPIGG